jgi:hypothetical protein
MYVGHPCTVVAIVFPDQFKHAQVAYRLPVIFHMSHQDMALLSRQAESDVQTNDCRLSAVINTHRTETVSFLMHVRIQPVRFKIGNLWFIYTDRCVTRCYTCNSTIVHAKWGNSSDIFFSTVSYTHRSKLIWLHRRVATMNTTFFNIK